MIVVPHSPLFCYLPNSIYLANSGTCDFFCDRSSLSVNCSYLLCCALIHGVVDMPMLFGSCASITKVVTSWVISVLISPPHVLPLGMAGYASGSGPGSGSAWGMDSGGMSDLGQVMDHTGMDLPQDMRQGGSSFMSHSGYRMSRGMSGEMAMSWGQSGRGMPSMGGSGSGYYGDYPSGMMQQQQYWRGGMQPGPSYGQTGMAPEDFQSMGTGGSFDGGDGGIRMRIPNTGMRMRGDVRSGEIYHPISLMLFGMM